MDLIAVTWVRSKWASAVIASVASLACSRSAADASPSPQATSEVDAGNEEFVPAALPEGLGSDDRGEVPWLRGRDDARGRSSRIRATAQRVDRV